MAVFDLIALIVCKAGAKTACDIGIAAGVTKVIQDWIYTGAVMIDTAAENPGLTDIRGAKMLLTNPERGLVAGNGVRFELEDLTTARHAAPEPGIIYHFPNFFTPEDLQSTTVRYTLDSAERKTTVELNQTEWANVFAYDVSKTLVPTPVLGWLVPVDGSKTLYAGRRWDTLTSGLYQFTSAQINQTFPLSLTTNMALPRYDCWFQGCVHKVAKASVSSDLGPQFVLDILPATLDEFVAWSQLGDQIDLDGDGLPDRPGFGPVLDPNRTKADGDGDGVPDSKENWYGSNPHLPDTDGDGLNDALELRYGTNPRSADTDGDGISDFDEVNGYLLTFATRSVHVTSDPLKRDTDRDGISDGAERRLNLLDPTRMPSAPRCSTIRRPSSSLRLTIATACWPSAQRRPSPPPSSTGRTWPTP